MSLPFSDTLIPPHDSISLSIRFKLPGQVSAEIKHEIFFRAYSIKNKLLAESVFDVHSEPFHDWDLVHQGKRAFFYPRINLSTFNLTLQNNGNVTEEILLMLDLDKKIMLISGIDWKAGRIITLAPYQDTTLKFFVRYTSSKDRVFDVCRVTAKARTDDVEVKRTMLIEKYSDIYSPLYIDKNLPHQTEVGFRTFSRNQEFLPFIKARGMTTFNNESTFRYNFNYYSQTGSEDLIGNSYYNFTYDWQDFRVGIGAFSSQLGRNLYTRNGIMISNAIKLSPDFRLEAMVAQSFFIRKTSAGVGYAINTKKTLFTGSISYDFDDDKKVNTGSAMFQSGLIPVFNNHDLSFVLYGYREHHNLTNEYTLMGLAWDVNYFARIGERVSFKFAHKYGSPNIPGAQMGMISFAIHPVFLVGNNNNFISFSYGNTSRKYYAYSFEGVRLPDNKLYNQYARFLYNHNVNANFKWAAGPSIEFYQSFRPSLVSDHYVEFQSEKIRFEIKAGIMKNLSINIKTGVSNNKIKDLTETSESRYDFHLLGAYSFKNGLGVSFGYDYGPMVNSGLYQFAGDAKNHSFNIGPTLMDSYFKERLSFNLFSSLIYRFDINYASLNINPRIELYVTRNWYIVASGTYHYTRQEFNEKTVQNAYTYFEFAIRKRWGKTDFNKWQKDTRRLKIVLFKDDNANGMKDDFEKGVPYVKTRVKLTNSNNPIVSTQFPVDITLLSNEAGLAIYNRLPMGFYELSITPLEDVKEYFYVDRTIEKIDLTSNTIVYIPFQKASKITGQINMARQQFIKKGEERIDLKNIRITAYNTQGNSYSSFTLEDGSFVIFVPNNMTYFVRMGNVFGDQYRITNNDMVVHISDSTSNQVAFNVVESGRQIKFKKAEPAAADTAEQAPLKVKVLHGKIYENTVETPADKDAPPEFNIPSTPEIEQMIIPGRFYVILSDASGREEALKYLKIVKENGIVAFLGFDGETEAYYVYTNSYNTKAEAVKELPILKKPGLRDARVVKF